MTSLYIHIPFCKKKCNYCDFVSYAGKEELIDAYVRALCKELEGEGCSLKTVYFGGGTPTLLEPRHFDKILTALKGEGSDVEISIEANPGTADNAKLKELRNLGINRLSIGAQSFNNRHLKTLGRIHTAEETLRFYDDARSAGFDNLNLDLIFALPDQTLDEWKKDLQQAIKLNPEHVSSYNLQIEEGTPLWEKTKQPSALAPVDEGFGLPSEDEELAMYQYTIEALTNAGYKHYEISNFAQSGFECLHNINYWKNGNYLGIGAGAHSHVDGKRWSNPDSIEEYIGNREIQSQVSSPSEILFLGLRLLDGLPIEKFTGFEKEVDELISDGLLMRENNHYKLTRRGLYLGNQVFMNFV